MIAVRRKYIFKNFYHLFYTFLEIVVQYLFDLFLEHEFIYATVRRYFTVFREYIQSLVHDPYTATKITSRFSRYPEADASEYLENLQEKFPFVLCILISAAISNM